MGSKWRKAKLALGLNTCLYVPQTSEDSSPSNDVAPARFSDVVSPSSMLSPTGHAAACQPTTPTPSSSGLRLSKNGAKSSKVCTFPSKRLLVEIFNVYKLSVAPFHLFFGMLMLV